MKPVIPPLPLLLIPMLYLPGAPHPTLEGGERWTNGPDAAHVLGQVDFTSSEVGTGEADRLELPWGVAVDPVSGKVFVAETG